MGVNEENLSIVAPPPMGLEASQGSKGLTTSPLYTHLKGHQIQPLGSPIVTEFVRQTYMESI